MLSRVAVVSLVIVLASVPVCGDAAPASPPANVAAQSPTVLVQGWWEHEHDENQARRRYWRLPPEAVERYNRIQAEINELQQQRHEIDEHIAHEIAEQHRILGFSGY